MKASNWKNCLSTTLLACLLGLQVSAVRAQDVGKPILLVASPGLQGAYSQTMLVAVPVGGKHLGFILNRATDLKLSTLFPEHAHAAKIADPVYFGGPEMNNALFAVVRSNPDEDSLQLFGDVFVTAKPDTIHRIIRQTPNDARYFAGFVGWMPGELVTEIASGLWYVAEPDASLIFRHETSGMWEEQVKRLGVGEKPPRAPGQIETRRDVPPPG